MTRKVSSHVTAKFVRLLAQLLYDVNSLDEESQLMIKELTDNHVVPDVVTDSEGNERWDFTVITKNYGILTCSYYPEIAQRTMFRFLKKQSLIMDWQKPVLTEQQLDSINVDKIWAHPLTQKKFEYAVDALKEILPITLSEFVIMAGQKALQRSDWDLNNKTHRWGKNFRPKDTFKQIEALAKRAARVGIELPKAGRIKGSQSKKPRYSKKTFEEKMSKAILSCGEDALRKDVAKILNYSYSKALERHLHVCGDGRKWREIVEDTFNRGKYKIPS
jgi:hypothetical protein